MEASKVYHHSRQLAYRSPFGAVPISSLVRLRLDIDQDMVVSTCFVCIVFSDEKNYLQEMMCTGKIEERYIYEQTIRVPEEAQVLHYYFVINSEEKLYYYGAKTGVGILKENADAEAYQITTYDSTFRTPDWFKHATIYQIFVDRYARSDERGGLKYAGYHQDKQRTIYLHENWHELPIYQPIGGSKNYDPCDFFGGDLQGVIDHLPRFVELGITCLYLNPIFEGISNHKYNTSDYMCIDPMFGNEEILRMLCQKAAELDIYVMLDGVFSHTGDDSIYFNKYGHYDDVGAYQSQQSPYYSWYTFETFPSNYQSWWGFETLPEVDELQESYQQFIATDEDSVINHWMNLGIAGWRLDVADELPDEFIALLRTAIKENNPNGVLLGEVWEDASNKISMDTKRQYVMGHELDSVMNYPLRDAIIDGLLGRIDMYEVVTQMEQLRENYPKEFFYACMNLISSHDMPRALSLLGGAPDKDSGLSREKQAHYHLDPAQKALALFRMRLAVCMQMVLPGAPCIYYGDEVGMEGLMDPFNRQTYPWKTQDQALLKDIKKLSNLRRNQMILRTGFMVLSALNPDVWCCIRFSIDGADAFGQPCSDGFWIVLINRVARVIPVMVNEQLTFEGPDADSIPNLAGTYQEYRTKEIYTLHEFDEVIVTLAPFEFYLLEKIR